MTTPGHKGFRYLIYHAGNLTSLGFALYVMRFARVLAVLSLDIIMDYYASLKIKDVDYICECGYRTEECDLF